MSGNLPQSGVELIIETGRYDRGMKSVIQGADRVDSALDGVVDSAQRAERALNDIDGSVTARVNVDDSEIRTAVDLVGELDTSETVNLNVSGDNEVSSALQGIEQQLTAIKALSVIDLASSGFSALSGAGIPLVNSILDADAAVRKLVGTTGREIPNAAAMINDLYTNAWGESRDEIAQVIIEASTLGIETENLATAVETAFEVVSVTGGETNEVLRTMDSLVKNNLVSSYEEAADVLVTGFQTGADRGQDLLDTFNEYGSTFKTLGIDAEGALALINSGLEAGIDNSDRIADALRETGIRLREIGTDENIAAAFDQLDAFTDLDLGAMLDAYNAGEISGNEFFTGFFGALQTAAETDAAAAASISATLVGTISEDFGPEVIAQLSPQWDDAMGTLEGRAQTAADTVNDTLGTAFTGLTRLIETELATALNDALDISGLIERLKGAVSDFSGALNDGATLTEAAAVALQIDPDSLARLESIIGNIGIAILQGMAGVLDFVGQGAAADALRDSVEDMAQTQLQFDVGLAQDGAALEEAIAAAAARGVAGGDIGAAIVGSLNEAIGSGDLIRANQIVGAIAGAGLDIDTSGYEAQILEQTAVIAEKFNTALANQDLMGAAELALASGDTTLLSAGIDAALAAEQPVLAQTLKDALAEFVNGADQYVQPEIDRLNGVLQSRFDNALTMGDFNLAKQIAEQSQDPEQLAEIAAWTEQLMATVQSGLDAGGENLAAAESAAMMLGDMELYAQVREAIDGTASSYTTMAETASTQLTVVQNDTTAMRSTVDSESAAIKTTLDGQKSVWQQWAESAVQAVDLIAERVVYVQGVLGGLNNDLTLPDGGGGASVPTAASGGTFGAGQMVETGHGGVELITMPAEGSIINAANSQQLMRAIQAVTGMGGGGGSTTNNYYINASQNLNAQSTGQANAAGNAFYNQIMGYGQ